jgi:hypothetical protein
MDERIVKLLEPMTRCPGASEAALERLRAYAGADLPADYLEFLRWSNGVSGLLATPRQHLAQLGGTGPEGHLHSAEETIDWTESWTGRLGYLFIGAFNDSGDHLLLDTRSSDAGALPYLLVDAYWSADDGEEWEGDETENDDGEGEDEDEVEDSDWDEDEDDEEDAPPFRAASLHDLLTHLAIHQVHLSLDLRGADLRGLDLSEVYFSCDTIAGADLTGANLRDAVLTECDFTRVNFTGADLRGALLHGADLTGANLADAQLTCASFDRKTRWPHDFDPVKAGAVKAP